MNLSFIQPPQVAWASGALADGPLLRKSTRIQDLTDVFADENARQQLAGEQVVYDVEMLDTSSAEGELYTGVTHLYPGRVPAIGPIRPTFKVLMVSPSIGSPFAFFSSSPSTMPFTIAPIWGSVL